MSAGQIKFRIVKNRVVVFTVITGLLLVILVVVILSLLSRPTRSVAAFCSTYKEQNAILAKSQGDTYSVRPFTHGSSSPHDFAAALGKLETVAPQDIESDVKTLKQIFEKIDQDPSQAFSASMSGLGAESSVDEWTSQRCQ